VERRDAHVAAAHLLDATRHSPAALFVNDREVWLLRTPSR
jgi:hypothetical protein